MHDVIEKLLILQDRDRQILKIQEQLSRITPERESFQARATGAQAGLDSAKLRGKIIETERKKLELEVDSKKQAIEKYALQQFQTKKNEEYRALAQQIETCRGDITKLEDRQLELMEHADLAAKELAAATRESQNVKGTIDQQLKDLAEREANLKSQLSELESNRDQLTGGIASNVMSRYTRLLKAKGGTVIVGINHGVCGGCHMKFPVQLAVQCQAEKELVSCPNCGRILYYTRDMDWAVAE
jgi:predicted  nucleic acid-binding Zn-ribbon protein